MADSMSVGNTNAQKIDLTRWKKLTPQEIMKEESNGEEVPAEIVAWAQQMAAFAKIPDNVTYEQVDGDVGLDALDKLGIPEEEVGLTTPQAQNAQEPTDIENPDAVKDTARAAETGEEPDEGMFALPSNEPTDETEVSDETDEPSEDDLSLADAKITADDETIRRRRARKGLA